MAWETEVQILPPPANKKNMEEKQNLITPTIGDLKESVEMELTAKGVYKWTIKLREEKIGIEIVERFKTIESELCKKFPNNVMGGEK